MGRPLTVGVGTGRTVCEMDRDEIRVRRNQSRRVRDALDEDYPHSLPLDLALLQPNSATCEFGGLSGHSVLEAAQWAHVYASYYF